MPATDQKVAGSSPTGCTIFYEKRSQLRRRSQLAFLFYRIQFIQRSRKWRIFTILICV